MTWQPTNNVEQDRLEKANRLRELGFDPYPARVQRSHSIAEALAAFEAAEAAGHEEGPQVTICGRIRRLNIKGKVSFMHIEDGTGRIQLFLRIDELGAELYNNLIKDKLLEVDDFVQASGAVVRTKTGEISVRVGQLRLLSKSLSPLPVIKQAVQEDGTVVEYGEFSDVESRYRQRYADLAVNAGVREIFRARARTLSALRRFLDDEGFLEVETPILQPVYGGAAARPFVTHHNQLHQDLYLRIAFELYLKRLLVGGYDAVYEIGRDFRNEGVSLKHNPEFTMLEFYKAYIDYRDVMDITERMLAYTAERVTGGPRIHYQGHDIDLTPPWPRMTIREAVQEFTGIDYMEYATAAELEEAIRSKLHPQDLAPGQSRGRLIVEVLLGNYVEKHLIQPTIIMDYPRDMSPFAKSAAGDETHVERFEFFIAGMEMGNAFTELNDPLDQERRFLEMRALYSDEEDEATPLDEDYLRAMRYGMPPNGGFGMGVDRLVMLLTGQRSIRDVLLFPHLRDPNK